MRVNAFGGLIVLLLCIILLSICGAAWGMDEAILTPTNDNIVPAEEQEFGRAMSVWNSHRYDDGEKLLRISSWLDRSPRHLGAAGRRSSARRPYRAAPQTWLSGLARRIAGSMYC